MLDRIMFLVFMCIVSTTCDAIDPVDSVGPLPSDRSSRASHIPVPLDQQRAELDAAVSLIDEKIAQRQDYQHLVEYLANVVNDYIRTHTIPNGDEDCCPLAVRCCLPLLDNRNTAPLFYRIKSAI
ncbi:MAG: hypothetical protein LBT90_01330, partial [Holosporaceae bacterium]|nr:hypothetical protein [Holosporaceae bacterium]